MRGDSSDASARGLLNIGSAVVVVGWFSPFPGKLHYVGLEDEAGGHLGSPAAAGQDGEVEMGTGAERQCMQVC